jgi:hypothetical protein
MDGHIDYMDTSNHDLMIRHGALSHDEVNEVKEMMAKRAFRKLHGVIQVPRRDRFQDYQTSLELIVHQPQGVQSFTLQGFDATDGKPFPPAFNTFLCLVDDLKKVDYRLSSGCRR